MRGLWSGKEDFRVSGLYAVRSLRWEVRVPTSVNNIPFVEIVDCLQDLSDRLGRILLCELALVAYTIEKLSTSGQLSDNVVLVLLRVSQQTLRMSVRVPLLIQTNRRT